jgi:hypothetical protein
MILSFFELMAINDALLKGEGVLTLDVDKSDESS